jgi:hypothetical protein
VVFLARDLTEYGIQRYGEAPGRGQELVEWVRSRYASCGRLGQDSLGHESASIELFVRRTPRVAIPANIEVNIEPEK